MKAESKKQAGGQLQVTIELTSDQHSQIKTQAAINLSTSKAIAGFRPGKAPYEVVEKHFGSELAQEELLLAVKKCYLPYLVEQNWQVVGKPELKLISPTPFVFQITSAVLPEVKLGQWQKINIKGEPVSVPQAKVDKMLQELRDGRASEALTDKPVAVGDRIVIDFQVAVEDVAVEGGQANDYSLIVGRGQLVPGFEEQLLGLRPGEDKKFDLKFPQNYHKNLVGKLAQVTTKIKSVYSRILPEANDDFAKGLGKFSSFVDLREKLQQNLHAEAVATESARAERQMFEEMLKLASFTDIPELLIINEVEQMMQEFSQGITNQGLALADYLTSIKKTVADLKQDWRAPGLKRVKTALIIRQLAKESNIEATAEQVDDELSELLQHFTGQSQVLAELDTVDYRDQLKSVLTNRQVVAWLKERLVEKAN